MSELAPNPTQFTDPFESLGDARVLAPAPRKVEKEVFQIVEGDVSYDVERRPDGSEWLLGQTGQPRKGAQMRLKAATGPEQPEEGLDPSASFMDPGQTPQGRGSLDVLREMVANDLPPNPTTFTDPLEDPDDAAVMLGTRRQRLKSLARTAIHKTGDVGRGMLIGADQFLTEMFNIVGLKDVADWLDEHDPTRFEINEPDTLAGQFAIPLTQGGLATIPAARITKGLAALGGFLRWTATGAIVDFAAFSPDEPGLGELAREIGELDNETLEQARVIFADAFAKNEDDTTLEKRLKNMEQGMVIGASIDGLIALYRGVKHLKNLPEGTQERVLSALGLDRDADGRIILAPSDEAAGGVEQAFEEVVFESRSLPDEARFANLMAALRDQNGADIIAKKLGILSPGSIEGPGFYDDASELSLQTGVQTVRIPGAGKVPDVAEADREALGLYSAIKGLLLKQDSVGWHRPLWKGANVGDMNGAAIRVGRGLTRDEMLEFADNLDTALERYAAEKGLEEVPTSGDFGLISTSDGVNILNFSELPNPDMHTILRDVTGTIFDEGKVVRFAADNELVEGGWKNGQAQGYLDRIRRAGRPDLLEWLGNDVLPRIRRAEDAFAAAHPKLGFTRDTNLDREIERSLGVPDGGPDGGGGVFEARGIDEGLRSTRDPTQSPDLGRGGGEADPAQFDLFERRGPGRAADRATRADPEGRSLIARYVAGQRQEGGPDVPLSAEEFVAVADALVDRIFLHPFNVSRASGFMDAQPLKIGAPSTARFNPDARADISLSQDLAPPPDALGELLNKGLEAGGAKFTPDQNIQFSPEAWARVYVESLSQDGRIPGIFAHELGHLIDLRAGGMKEAVERLRKRFGPLFVPRDVLREAGSAAFPRDVVDDMVKLSKLRRPRHWDLKEFRKNVKLSLVGDGNLTVTQSAVDDAVEAHNAYMHSARELMADTIAMYSLDPATAKRVAPNAAKFARDLVNDNPKVNPIIQFNVGLVGAVAAGALGGEEAQAQER